MQVALVCELMKGVEVPPTLPMMQVAFPPFLSLPEQQPKTALLHLCQMHVFHCELAVSKEGIACMHSTCTAQQQHTLLFHDVRHALEYTCLMWFEP